MDHLGLPKCALGEFTTERRFWRRQIWGRRRDSRGVETWTAARSAWVPRDRQAGASYHPRRKGSRAVEASADSQRPLA